MIRPGPKHDMELLRNPVYLTRTFFILIATLIGYWVGRGYSPSHGLDGSAIGFTVAVIMVVFEVSTSIISSKKIILAGAGLLFGLIMSWFIYPTIPPNVFGDDATAEGLYNSQNKARILCNLVFGYLGIVLAIKHANRFSFSRLNFIMANPADAAKLLDTSVIVDGRIKDLLAMHFLQGNFVVPGFVLDELQKIADSSDAKRRSRGRRGLEMLEKIKEASPRVSIMEKDYPEVKDVDHKLIAMAKDIGGEIVTNDYNLQKVAQFHKVRVLNINELSSILKPSVYVGESLHLYVSKEGKESHQGVGYLEDGTMVVIEDGRSRIGSEVEASVTSILQTPAGRMIFARMNGNGEVAPARAPRHEPATPSPDASPGEGQTPHPRRSRERL